MDESTTLNKGQIYCIKNCLNDLKYVGQTTKIRKAGKYMRNFGYEGRFLEHKTQTVGKKASILGKAMRELGIDCFYVELLEECEIQEIDNRERYWIDTLGTLYPNGYNVLYGAPYSQNEYTKRKISDGMKAFFKNEDVRKVYSAAHINKFKDVSTDRIKSIHMNPIKKDGNDHLVYMYIVYEDGSKVRRRYGGAHEEFDEAYARCYEDAKDFLKGDITRIITPNRAQQCASAINDEIEEIEVKLHKMGVNQLVAVYIETSTCTSKKARTRHVFGGKTIALKDAYTSATEFVNTIKTTNTKVCIRENLLAATSSN